MVRLKCASSNKKNTISYEVSYAGVFLKTFTDLCVSVGYLMLSLARKSDTPDCGTFLCSS